MKLKLRIWRQKNANEKGGTFEFEATDISEDMSFLEMLDVVNERLIKDGKDPIAFDSDCREGICGTCGMVIDGVAHGPERATTVCQLHMRHFNSGDKIYIEPFRAKGFPVIKDLVVDRSAFDRIQQAGGYISVNTSGNTQDANATPISNMRLMRPWMPLLALVAEHVLLLVRTRLPCYLLAPKYRNMHYYHKDRLKQPTV